MKTHSDSATKFFGIFSPWIQPSFGPLINRLTWFCWKIRFREDICEISDSAQTNTARSQTLRRQTLVGVLPASILFCFESLQKTIFSEKKHFSPLLRDPGVFDSWEKEKCQKNLVTLKKSIEIFYLVFHQVRLNIKFLSLRRFWFLEGKQQWYEDFKFVKSCTYLNAHIHTH